MNYEGCHLGEDLEFGSSLRAFSYLHLFRVKISLRQRSAEKCNEKKEGERKGGRDHLREKGNAAIIERIRVREEEKKKKRSSTLLFIIIVEPTPPLALVDSSPHCTLIPFIPSSTLVILVLYLYSIKAYC